MKKGLSVRTVVAIGIGAAVFIILKNYLSVPTPIPDTTIQSSYPFQALMSAIFGPIAGLFIGLIGHSLGDAILYGSPWWTWVLGSGLMGLVFSLASKGADIEHGEFTFGQMVKFNVIQIIGNLVVWGLIAPVGDILVYKEPANKVFIQGAFAGITNALGVLIVGTLLIKAYAATRTRRGSLNKE